MKKIKKITAILTTALLLSALLTGCSQSDDGNGDTTTTQSASENTTTASTESEVDDSSAENTSGDNGTEGSEQSGSDSSSSEVTPASILEAIKEAYGDSYLPDVAMDSEMLSAMFGISEDLYEEFVAETPMIGAHPDTVIILYSPGKADEAEQALNDLRDMKISDTMQYPMNVAKVNATKVVRNGDYVAFFTLGAVDERSDVSDEEAADFAEEQVQIAVDTFNSMF